MDIVLNPTEANEMRTTAFNVLMELRVDASVVELIVMRLHAEKDLYLSSFILSYLHAYANSTYEPVMDM